MSRSLLCSDAACLQCAITGLQTGIPPILGICSRSHRGMVYCHARRGRSLCFPFQHCRANVEQTAVSQWDVAQKVDIESPERWLVSICVFAHCSAHLKHEVRAGRRSVAKCRPLALSCMCLQGRQRPMQSTEDPSARQKCEVNLSRQNGEVIARAHASRIPCSEHCYVGPTPLILDQSSARVSADVLTDAISSYTLVLGVRTAKRLTTIPTKEGMRSPCRTR